MDTLSSRLLTAYAVAVGMSSWGGEWLDDEPDDAEGDAIHAEFLLDLVAGNFHDSVHGPPTGLSLTLDEQLVAAIFAAVPLVKQARVKGTRATIAEFIGGELQREDH